MRDNLGNTDHEKKQDMQGKPVHGFFYHLFGILKAAALIIIFLIAASTALHQTMTVWEKGRTPPAGDLVTADGHKMSIYVTGRGENTIVLLPGLGTAAPILDFMPLAQALARENRVVVVEPLGYGWSDTTKEARTVENSVEELRSALKAEGLDGPCVLMPHSISGIDALYYANTYPDEVCAVIGIDCTLPAMPDYFGEGEPAQVPAVLGLLNPVGIIRWSCMLNPDAYISDNSSGLYTPGNLAMQKRIAARMGQNATVIDQMNRIGDNLEITKDMKFDSRLPLLFFTRDGSSQEAREDGKSSGSFYQTYVTNEECQRVVPLNGGHYLHWTCSEEMAEEVGVFLRTMSDNR